MTVRNFYFFLVLLFCVALLNSQEASAQAKRRVIQLSGFVTDTTGAFLPGVNLYVPKAGRGTSTSRNGFFSLPVLVGDSLTITCIGYRPQSYTVPDDAKEFTSVLLEMSEDYQILPPVYVMQTEELFKEAVLALNIPLDNTGIDPKSMNAELMALMVKTTPMDGNANYRYYIEQFSTSAENKFHPIYNPFLNPLNWVKFIKDMKKKKKAAENRN
ncbi:hypothetical protein WSM22_05570 [Cytophagales bacterium WSM2-2]|nr:hypothetical protein WSM22_05570 [Cytophagales bacterium WSM2-2]